MILLHYNSETNVRLDRYLQQKYETLSFAYLNKALRENKIKVNGKKVPLSTRLKNGDEIKLFLREEQLRESPLLSAPPIHVIYEDSNLLIVDKPAGIISISEDMQANSMLLRCKQYVEQNYNKAQADELALCHRLDTGTSGLLILAKNSNAEHCITELIQAHQIKKTYLCVTYGHPKPENATLNGFLVKNEKKATVKIVSTPVANSKPVTTAYKTMAVSGALALLEVSLITGRTHQIRAHMASIQCPIVGDSKYGNLQVNRSLKFKYQALCSYKLNFPVITGEFSYLSNLEVKTTMPWYAQQVIEKKIRL